MMFANEVSQELHHQCRDPLHDGPRQGWAGRESVLRVGLSLCHVLVVCVLHGTRNEGPDTGTSRPHDGRSERTAKREMAFSRGLGPRSQRYGRAAHFGPDAA